MYIITNSKCTHYVLYTCVISFFCTGSIQKDNSLFL